MSVVDNFSRIGTRMIEGMMFHEELMKTYYFLGLKGYSACHKYHYLSESDEYLKLTEFVIDNYDCMLSLSLSETSTPDIAPVSWLTSDGRVRQSIQIGTRQQAIISAFDKWISWEESTKKLYEEEYFSVMNNDTVASEYIKELVSEIQNEINYAKNERLMKRAMDFDIVSILEEQDKYERTFNKMIKKK